MSLASIGAKVLGMGAGVAVNWQAYAVKALAVLLIAGGIFFGGFYTGSQSTLKPLAQATVQAAGKAATAQHDHDVAQHGAAVVVSKAADARHKSQQAKAAAAVAAIENSPSLPLADPHLCDIPLDVLKAMNDAGH